MTRERLALGARGEEAAARLLRRQGFRILHRNYTCRFGEIDIVARKVGLLVFAEVKTRRSDAFAPPEVNVTRDKQQRLARLANYYIKRFGLQDLSVRFDVIAVLCDPSARGARLKHFPAAFEASPY